MEKVTLGPISALRIFVDDLERAKSFYRDVLGLDVILDGDDFAIFEPGGCQLIVETVAADAPEDAALVGRFVGVSFGVADVSATCAAIAAHRGVIDHAPERQDWGGILAHIRDPAGNILTLVQQP